MKDLQSVIFPYVLKSTQGMKLPQILKNFNKILPISHGNPLYYPFTIFLQQNTQVKEKKFCSPLSATALGSRAGWLVTHKIYAHIQIWGGTTFFYMYTHKNNLAFNSEHMQACHTEVMLLIPGR